MNPAETAVILRQFNEWRRGDEDIPQFDPREIGEAIDAAVEMIDRLEAADKSDAESIAMYRKARDERDALRDRIAEMERQDPVAWMLNCPTLGGDTGWILSWTQSGAGLCNRLQGEENEKRLYAIPCVQPESSVNEGVRKVTLGFRWESEAQHHIPTIEIEFDPVSPDSPNDAKGWQDRDRLAAMLTPEAKP